MGLGDLATARLLFQDSVAAGRANTQILNTLLKGLSRAGDSACLDEAFALMAEAGNTPGCRPNIESYNLLIDACARQDDVTSAVRIFEQLPSLGLRPDGVTYTTLAKGLSRAWRVAEAAEVCREMLADPAMSPPDLAMANMAADVFSRAGLVEEAERALDVAISLAKDQGLPPPIEAFTPVILSHAKAKRVDAALEYTRRFLQQGGEADDVLIEILVEMCMRTGEFRRAMQLVEAMERSGRPVDRSRFRPLLL